MQIAGMIIEYNPLHNGHLYLVEQLRGELGAETGVIGVMSGNYVQRGDFALIRKHQRARAAVESGVDLVLELPLPWAVASAERFADGGIQVLEGTGLVSHLAFGSECGDADALRRLAAVLEGDALQGVLQKELERGDSFAAARQRAAERLVSAEDAALLRSPNNILGVEYCKSLLRRNSDIVPLSVKRRGTGYHATELEENLPSATLVRSALREGEAETAVSLMAPAMSRVYREEVAAGRAPVFRENCERAILARLRSMDEAEFAALDQGKEGLYRRLYEASREAATVAELLEQVKTKRYAYTRLQRMVLWAWLGLRPEEFPETVPYLRILAANERGRHILSRMKKTAALPILTKPADVRKLPEDARRLFALEVRATDLYALAYPELSAAAGGAEWREGPAIL